MVQLSQQDKDARTQSAYNAFEQGSSLADHVGNIVHDFVATLSADHHDLAITQQFQRKLADLGRAVTIRELLNDIPILPPHLQNYLSLAMAVYVHHQKRVRSDERAKAEQIGVSSIEPATDQSISAATSIVAKTGLDHVAQEPRSTATDFGPDQEPMIFTDSDTAAPAILQDHINVGHDSTVESVGSPQAFRTPPEQPIEAESTALATENQKQLHQQLTQLNDSIDAEEEDELISEVDQGEQDASADHDRVADAVEQAAVEIQTLAGDDQVALRIPPSELVKKAEKPHKFSFVRETDGVAHSAVSRSIQQGLDKQINASPEAVSVSGVTPQTAQDIHDSLASGLKPPANPVAEQGASAVPAVKQARLDQGALRSGSNDASISAPSATNATGTTMQEDGSAVSTTIESGESTAGLPASAIESETAANDAPRAHAVQTGIGAQEPNTSLIQAEPLCAVKEVAPRTAAATAALISAKETQVPFISATSEAVLPRDDARATPSEVVDNRAAASEPQETRNDAEARDQGQQVSAAIAKTSTAVDPARACASDKQAKGGATADSVTGSRPKMSINDRMKLLLNDLAKVTGRKPSFETIQKLKPLRAGQSTPRTIPDQVDKWQEPAQMIPWTCFQELGPDIFHKSAHKYMHLSMHELMDKVSNTRSVRLLSEKLLERVMTRALMEFPRIPHMLHCWTEEKRKYFASRSLPQPTDTKPEFRFADEEEQERRDVETAGRSSVSAAHIEAQQREPEERPLAKASGPTTSKPDASSMTVPSSIANTLTFSATSAASRPWPMKQTGTQFDGAAQRQVMTAQLLNSHGLPATRPPPRDLQSNMQPTQLYQMATSMLPADSQLAFAVQGSRAVITSQNRVQPARVAPVPSPHVQPQPPRQPSVQQTSLQRVPATPSGGMPAPYAATRTANHLINSVSARAEELAANAAIKRVMWSLATDCLSLADHVALSPASAVLNVRAHFSEADVEHVVNFVVETYRREMEEEHLVEQGESKAAERFRKIVAVRAAAVQVLSLTKTLAQIKMCITEATLASLRRSGKASTDGWLDLLATAPKWKDVKLHLLNGKHGWMNLSRVELAVLLQTQVKDVNRSLDAALESLMRMDNLVGPVDPSADKQQASMHEALRKECEQIGRMCCKHVVGVLLSNPDEQHSMMSV